VLNGLKEQKGEQKT